MTPDPAPAETLKLLPESTPVLRFVYISALELFNGSSYYRYYFIAETEFGPSDGGASFWKNLSIAAY